MDLSSDSRRIRGRPVVAGVAEGSLLVADRPLSFWGGYDPRTGCIIDRRHPLCGACAAGRVLALPSTRGSSTTTAVLLEAIREGTAPAAILTRGVDRFLALSSIVAGEMYGRSLPLVALPPSAYDGLGKEGWARVAGGEVTISPRPPEGDVKTSPRRPEADVKTSSRPPERD